MRTPTTNSVVFATGDEVDVSKTNPLPVSNTGATPRLTATFARPADNTAYSAGDIVANSGTGNLVVPITFTLGRDSGRITGCRCVVTPASANLVIAALDFDLLLFRSTASIPFAAAGYPADNTALAVSAAAFRDLVGTFRFSASNWRNPAGTLVAGITGYQAVTPNSSRMIEPFNISGLGGTILGLVQVLSAWTPTGIVNQFDFALDCDLD